MAEITVANVAKLRELTGVGMMECKKALVEAQGNIEVAIDNLRKSGAASAAKKATREAREGVIAQHISPGGKSGVLLEVNCETDFVARNEAFRAFCDDLAKKIANDPNVNLEADREAAVGKMGENIKLTRNVRLEVSGSGLVAAYIHTGAKIGVLAEVGAGKPETTGKDEFKQLVKDITLQIAAGCPSGGFARGGPGGSGRQGTRNRRAIGSPEGQAGGGDGKDPGGCAGQILPDLLPRGSGRLDAQF